MTDTRIDRNLLLLLLFPFLLTMLNEGWMFLEEGFVDAWIYFSYFLDLKFHLKAFSKTYFSSRLPWILPGFLAHKLFSPLIATTFLHLTFYCTALTSLYLILKHNFNSRSALLAALLMGSDGYFLRAIGSRYVDGAGITYFLLSLLALTYASKKSPRFLLLSGLFYGCLIYTQPFLVVYTPLILLYYLFLHPNKKLSNLILFSLGFFTLTLFLCTLNYALTRRFLFFLPSYNFATQLVPQNPWWQPFSQWWTGASWLILPLFTTLLSIATLCLRPAKSVRFFLFLFLSQLFLFIFIQFVLKYHALQYHFYASYLLPTLFLALGALLSPTLTSLSQKQFSILVFLILFSSLFIYAAPLSPLALSLLLASLVLIPLFFQHTTSPLIISLSFLAFTLYLSDPYSFRNAASHKQSLLAVTQNMQILHSLDPQCKARFWYNHKEPLGSFFRAVASTRLWGHRLVNNSFPTLHQPPFHAPLPNNLIFILSTEEHPLEKANQALAQIHLQGELLSEQTLTHNSIHYKITLLKMSPIP